MALGDQGLFAIRPSKLTDLEFADDLNAASDTILYPGEDSHESVPEAHQVCMATQNGYALHLVQIPYGSQFPNPYACVDPVMRQDDMAPCFRKQMSQSPAKTTSTSLSEVDFDARADFPNQTPSIDLQASPRRKRKCRRGTSCPAVRAIAEAAAAEAAEISHQLVESKRRSCISDGSDSEKMLNEAVREKNRQSARDCRLRKKHYILGLESKVEELQKRVDDLQKRFDEKDALCASLQQQLAQYQRPRCSSLQMF